MQKKVDAKMTAPPFQRIVDACKTTGLSQCYLRKGCKDGSIPHIKSGNTYYINIPALLSQLGVADESAKKEVTSWK